MPSGGIQLGEQPLDGARRELKQEVGISVSETEIKPLLHFVEHHDYMHDEVFTYEVRLEDQPEIRVDNREVIDAEFASLNHALAANLTPVARRVLEHYASDEATS